MLNELKQTILGFVSTSPLGSSKRLIVILAYISAIGISWFSIISKTQIDGNLLVLVLSLAGLATGNVSYLAANNNGGTAKVIAYQPFWANQGVNTVSVISTGVISAPYYMCGVESDTGSFDITSTFNTFVRLTSSTVTMTLGTASAYAGFYRRLMCGTSTVSLNITSACIYLQSGANYWYNGTPSFTMNAGPGSNCSIEIWCDGVNWYVRA